MTDKPNAFAFRNKYGKTSDTHIIASTVGPAGFKALCGVVAEPHKVKAMLPEGKKPCGRCAAKVNGPQDKQPTPKKIKEPRAPQHSSGRCAFKQSAGLRIYRRSDATTRPLIHVWYLDLVRLYPHSMTYSGGRWRWEYGRHESFYIVAEDLDKYDVTKVRHAYGFEGVVTFEIVKNADGFNHLEVSEVDTSPAAP